VPFSLLVGAGSGKRTQNPLGAHQQRVLIDKGEHGRFDSTDRIRNHLYRFLCWKIQHHQILYINASIHLRRFTPIIGFTLYFASRNKKNLAPNVLPVLDLNGARGHPK
jgi:hypothetical protein